MKSNGLIAATALAAAFWATAASAQITEQQPAEFPPASYKGKQYVDSNGCVFIRAGIDGDVSWVPRVSRDRKIICGFRPSLAQATEAEAAPTEEVAETPSPTTTAEVAPKSPPAAVSAPAPRRTAQAAVKPAKPKRKKKPVVVRQTAPKPKPKVVAKPQVATVVQEPAAQTAAVATACPGASAISQQYLRGSGVRCGPQKHVILPYRVAGSPGVKSAVVAAPTPKTQAAPVTAPTQPEVQITAHTRIVPKHVAENRVNTRNVKVPKGYRPVWEDDRLNPHRAEQNLAGRADMLLVWTQTLPRRLINQNNGKDVTAKVPLIYPYTDVATQRREVGEVSIVQRDGQVMKRIIRNKSKSSARKPVYSSRSAPKAIGPDVKAPAKPRVGKSYVQIGVFQNPENANRAARGIARMGMPARIGKVRSKGKTYMKVQAGPFVGAGDTQSALRLLRGAGYKDAVVR